MSARRGALAWALAVSLWAAGCAPPPAPSDPPPQAAPPRQMAPAPRAAAAPVAPGQAAAPPAGLELEQLALAGINRHRTSIGLAPLAYDPRLADIARTHSRAMADGITDFGHEGFAQRAAQVRSLMPARGFAENVWRSTRPVDQVVDAAVQGWLSSPVHRRNIEGRYTASGIGAARSASGATYLTEIFIGN